MDNLAGGAHFQPRSLWQQRGFGTQAAAGAVVPVSETRGAGCQGQDAARGSMLPGARPRMGAADGWLLYRLNFYLTDCQQQDLAPHRLWAEKARLRAGVLLCRWQGGSCVSL